MTPLELLDAFRKTGSKTSAAQELGISKQTQVYKEGWEQLVDLKFVEDASNEYGGPRWVITRKGVKNLALWYEGDSQ